MEQGLIGIYLPDPYYGRMDIERDRWEVITLDFKREIESEFQQEFAFTSIGPGWAEAAYYTYVSFGAIGATASAVVTLFFQGERINKNLDAWSLIYKKIAPFVHRNPTLDRNGAAALAVEKVCDRLGGLPASIELIGHCIVSKLVTFGRDDDPGFLTDIEPAPTRVTSPSVYVFQIKADERQFRVLVHGVNVRLIETEAKPPSELEPPNSG
jgi:hypothetical protein